MTKSTSRFKSPPVTRKDDGDPRMVGFELEFSGLTLEQIVDALRASLGGDVTAETAAVRVVEVDGVGAFNVELDWDFLKRTAADEAEKDEGGEWIETLSRAAALLVPMEVVCPPIPMTDLARLDPMVVALRDAGATGTEESLIAAYGVHINTEIPRLDAATVMSYVTAFSLLQWWLVDAHAVDATRKISPYIDLYPDAYVKQIFAQSAPAMEEVFADYLEHNATRNRALDLLPLLAEIDGDRVGRVVDDPRIKVRPAFHYRLPNCHIERPDWSLAGSWNVWWVVEELAHRPQDLDDLKAAYLDAERPLLGVNRKDWVKSIDRWLRDRELA